MMKVAPSAAHSELASNCGEESIGSATSGRLLSSYLLNLHRGAGVVKGMIDRDRRIFLDLGAKDRAADLEAALRSFLSCFPEAGGETPPDRQVKNPPSDGGIGSQSRARETATARPRLRQQQLFRPTFQQWPLTNRACKKTKTDKNAPSGIVAGERVRMGCPMKFISHGAV